METIMSSEFARMLSALSTAIVLTIVWFGYYRGIFVRWISLGFLFVFVAYMSTLLLYRYVTDHMAEHAAREEYYAVIASLHGTMSLGALVLACIMIGAASYKMTHGENYFRTHQKLSLLLVLLWPFALLSGLFL